MRSSSSRSRQDDAAPEYRRQALEMLGRTQEAEAEARRAYATEQGRRLFQHNWNGADAVAAAADTARERTAQSTGVSGTRRSGPIVHPPIRVRSDSAHAVQSLLG